MKSKNITYEFRENYISIQPMVWRDVPPFAVITGENGAGKTHLMELLAASYGVQVFDSHAGGLQTAKKIMVSMLIDGEPTGKGVNAIYVDARRPHEEWAPVSIDAVVQQVHHLYNAPSQNAANWRSNPLYADWIENRTPLADGAVQIHRSAPSWAEFEAKLTPRIIVAGIGTTSNPAAYFVAYQLLVMAAKERCKTAEDLSSAMKLLGDAPWDLMNRYCEEAGIKFRCVPPEISFSTVFGRGLQQYDPVFLDIDRNIHIRASSLSAGERAMLAVVSWRFLTQTAERHFDVILMDEPDAHLHPSLTKQYIDVLKTVMVDQYGARVIMTTHSPSTVALAPRDSVFEIKRTGESRIEPVKNVSEVIARLTGGFVAVDSATKFVVIEGQTDEPFYKDLWTLMTEAGMPQFPGVAFLTRDGCAKVRDTVDYLRKWNFERFYGVLDRDSLPNRNEPADGLFVTERNGIENYLFDPLNIWLCLWLENPKVHERLYQVDGLRRGNGGLFKDLPAHELQNVVDSVWDEMKKELPEIDPHFLERVPVRFRGGLCLSYPRWFIEYDDHELAATARNAFKPYPLPPGKLSNSFMTLNLIPDDLWKIFEQIVGRAAV
ncbi:AAA domain-containing protein, putative AbiEii toxin, Type IV TA system [Paraburkholderia steynii]|uniref:AAA domain-containing protein, putative AbiEii toxin, Type IV TA system n=1 Tax=Paraburkholderia steynii TaxID=1245441 RepID=A0A7Z7FN44_9BURK|nr:AAA family ATPase [Paraburkholderia steynii]SDJ36407.1 AAA domain-containing protein, putative AbiEii toxin, Type IV TA system [Paraburkholderia steynii]